METGPRFIVPSDGLEKPGIEPATPGLQGEWHNHCTTEASRTNQKKEKQAYAIYITWFAHFEGETRSLKFTTAKSFLHDGIQVKS